MMNGLSLRFAKSDDEESICVLLGEMHQEIGLFPLSMRKVMKQVREVLKDGRALVAEIDGHIVGSIGLLGSEPWYSEQQIITDYWIFVSSEIPKRLSVFRAMIAKVTEYAKETRMPLVLTLYSEKDRSRKTMLFERYGNKIMTGFKFSDVGGDYRVQ